VSGRKLAGALEKAGSEVTRVVGDHAFMYNAQTDRTATFVLTSKALSAGLISGILRQAGPTAEDLRRLLGAKSTVALMEGESATGRLGGVPAVVS